MATVTRSAADSAARLFNTISVTAGVFTTAVGAVGNACDVLSVKSQDWLDDTRKRSAGMAEERNVGIIDDCTFAIARRMEERERTFASSPGLKAHYEAALERVEAAVNAAEAT